MRYLVPLENWYNRAVGLNTLLPFNFFYLIIENKLLISWPSTKVLVFEITQ